MAIIYLNDNATNVEKLLRQVAQLTVIMFQPTTVPNVINYLQNIILHWSTWSRRISKATTAAD